MNKCESFQSLRKKAKILETMSSPLVNQVSNFDVITLENKKKHLFIYKR